MLTPEEYLAAMNRIAESGDTPPLSEFRQLAAYDPNTIYRLGPDHAAALLDEANDRIDELAGQLAAAHEARQAETNRATGLALQLEQLKGTA